MPIIFIMILLLIQNCASTGYQRHSPSSRNKMDMVEVERIFRKAEQLNKNFTMKNLLSHIRIYFGTPYQRGGISYRGMDCSGFVMKVYEESFTVQLPHNAASMYQQTEAISVQDLQTGDLLFFENINGRGISHVGIYLVDDHFVHSSIYHGITLSRLTEAYYQQRFRGARRVVKQHQTE